MKSDRELWFAWALLVVAVATVATICVLALLSNRADKERCEERGGRIVDVHSIYGGWFCEEPTP